LLATLGCKSSPSIREQTSSYKSGHADATLGVGRYGVAAPLLRRAPSSPVHTPSVFVAPEIEIETDPMRTAALVSPTTPSTSLESSIVHAPRSRGPPCS
jgi:hypothetical protein